MALNIIWAGFFIIAFLMAVYKAFLASTPDPDIFNSIVSALFDRAKTGFQLSLFLTGVMALWMGIMKIGEESGLVEALARWINPVFSRLFPEVPKKHKSYSSMMMNISANMLGLDNAATPLGLKAMEDLHEVNPKKDTASNAQIMFLVLNTSGLTLIPVSILALRAASNSASPSDVFIPILLATTVSTLVGLTVTLIIQKNFNLLIWGLIFAFIAIMAIAFPYLKNINPDSLEYLSKVGSNFILFSVIAFIILWGLFKKINVYEAFIDGAKDGFGIAVKIIPYLIAMLTAIGVFTASGAMDYVLDFFRWFFASLHVDTRFVDGLPTAFLKPLTGGGARAAMVESWKEFGVDSFVGHLTSILQGSTETTFYVLAVYFGSVGIKKTRYAVWAGLAADFAGIVAAIVLTYIFFGHLK